MFISINVMFARTYSAEVNEANVRIARQNNGDDIFPDAARPARNEKKLAMYPNSITTFWLNKSRSVDIISQDRHDLCRFKNTSPGCLNKKKNRALTF